MFYSLNFVKQYQVGLNLKQWELQNQCHFNLLPQNVLLQHLLQGVDDFNWNIQI